MFVEYATYSTSGLAPPSYAMEAMMALTMPGPKPVTPDTPSQTKPNCHHAASGHGGRRMHRTIGGKSKPLEYRYSKQPVRIHLGR